MSSIVSKAVDEVWESVVGPAAQSLHWLKSVVFGEFADNRPLSALVADMLVSFLPGVVIVTSARDAVAIVLRLAQHPEKREEVLEWIVLIACLVAVAFPLAAAAAGTAAAGVGAIVAGIAGSEAAAALRAVILMLVKESGKLVEMVQFLNKFIKGDVLQFLRAIKFTQYEKDFVQAFQKITDKLIGVVQNLRTQLLGMSVMGAKLADHVDTVKDIVKKLAEWERKFYAVQEAGLKQIPKATAELQARLDKLLAQSRAKDAHVASAGVKAEKPAAAKIAKQEVRDVAGKVVSDGATQTRKATNSAMSQMEANFPGATTTAELTNEFKGTKYYEAETAAADGSKLAHTEYTIQDGQLYIERIDVEDVAQGKGVSKGVFAQILKDNPDITSIKAGTLQDTNMEVYAKRYGEAKASGATTEDAMREAIMATPAYKTRASLGYTELEFDVTRSGSPEFVATRPRGAADDMVQSQVVPAMHEAHEASGSSAAVPKPEPKPKPNGSEPTGGGASGNGDKPPPPHKPRNDKPDVPPKPEPKPNVKIEPAHEPAVDAPSSGKPLSRTEAFAKANAVRDEEVARIKTLPSNERNRVTTVVGVADPVTGQVGIGVKRVGDPENCAEDLARADLASKTNTDPDEFLYSPAVRPRNERTIPVCKRCQERGITPDQLPPGTPFEE